MKQKDLQKALDVLYPNREPGYLKAFGKRIGKGPVTISRWVHGVATIGKTEAILIRLLVNKVKQDRRKGRTVEKVKVTDISDLL